MPPNASGRLASSCQIELPVGEIHVESHNPSVAWIDVESLFVKAARQFDKEFHLAGKELRLSILPTLRVSGNRKETVPAVFYVACRPSQLSLLPKSPTVVPVVDFTKAVAREPGGLGAGFREKGYFRLSAPLLEADAEPRTLCWDTQFVHGGELSHDQMAAGFVHPLAVGLSRIENRSAIARSLSAERSTSLVVPFGESQRLFLRQPSLADCL